MPGFFVVVEGPEGAGKSTLVSALASRLRAEGLDPVVVREPGGTPVAEALRSAMLDGGHLSAERELLFAVTARADLVARVIQPALEAGRFVLSDRYDLSTRAYQGAGRGIPADHVDWVNRAATGGLQPDLTLVLDLHAPVGRDRQLNAGKVGDRLDRESEAFHARVVEFYRRAQGRGLVHLDGTDSPEAVADAAWSALQTARRSAEVPR